MRDAWTGVVYRARAPGLDRQVANKFLAADLIEDSDSDARERLATLRPSRD